MVKTRRIVPAMLAVLVAAGLWWFDVRNAPSAPDAVGPPDAVDSLVLDVETRSSESDLASHATASANEMSDGPTIDQLLVQARELVESMTTRLDDYTATFVKQEIADDGKMGEESIIAMKVQTRFRNESNDAAKRVYLKFESPAALAGREVLWGEDLYDGQMAVHETAFLLNLKTIWLNPTGMIAMSGQRYPISEIGMVRLAEKLIQRGDSLRGETGLRVEIEPSIIFDGVSATRYRIIRESPVDGEDDFSSAEIVMDLDRSLILQYRSFGWPKQKNQPAPMLESYSYLDVEVNVGLSDQDFDIENPRYNFP